MDNRTVCVIQHVACETLGRIEDALKAEGLGLEIFRTYEQNPLPQTIEAYKGVILMGGPMGVYEQDRYGHLTSEMRLMAQAAKENKPVLGVCLGSQLLAAALGASVSKSGFKEIGWHPVTLTDSAMHDPLWSGVPRSFHALHWHGDIFTLPNGALSLARSDLTEFQAFRYGANAYGFLFHMEVTM
jgi:GMP synthase (glutamine-hydrolysing)